MIGAQYASPPSRSLASKPADTVITCSRTRKGVRVVRDDLGLFPKGEFPGLIGLGLAIARNIVQMHGGEITVNSQPGAGTEIRIDMPGSGR